MIRLFAILFFLAISSCLLKAQNVSFQSVYGTTSPEDAADLVKCHNGDFLIVGNTVNASQQSKTELLRVDNMGILLWSKTLSASVLKGFVIKKGIQTLDGGFCFIGNFIDTPPQDTSYPALIKTDGNGQVLWTKQIIGPTTEPNEVGMDISEASDSNLYICGYLFPVPSSSVTNPFIAKFSVSGQLSWFKQFISSSNNGVSIMAFTPSIIYLGFSGYSATDLLVTEFDNSCNIIKSISVADGNNNPLELTAIRYNPIQHSLLLLGGIPHNGVSDAPVAFYLDTAFTYSNESIFEGNPTDTISVADYNFNSQGQPLILAYSRSTYARMIIMDMNTAPIAMGLFVDTLNKSTPCRMQSGSQGCQFILSKKLSVSGTPEDFVLTRTLNTGTWPAIPTGVCYYHLSLCGDTSPFPTYVNQIITANSYTNTIVSPTILSTSSVIPSTNNCLLIGISEETNANNPITLFPNPSNGNIQLNGDFPSNSQLHLYNLLGEEIIQPKELSSGTQTIPLELNLAEGIYFCRIISDNEILHSEKLIIVR